jgi:hypothetical protein
MSFLSGVSGDTLEAIELMVSELATNCVRHTSSGFELAIIRNGRDIRVEATDGAGGTPTMRSPEPTDPSGRGLKIIDMLSETWGVEHRSASGKTVWFTVADTAASGARASRADVPTAYPATSTESGSMPGVTARADPSHGPVVQARPRCEGHRHSVPGAGRRLVRH